MKWRKLSDERPETLGDYLVAGPGWSQISILIYQPKDDVWFTEEKGDVPKSHNPSHWMPLPIDPIETPP